MKFAPVLIPTLNRYEHLKKCLDSLSRCTGAEHTEVYVALDYPPSEKYVEGWKQNKAFLENCGDMGFKKLHVIKRDHNFGIWKPGDEGNAKCLVEEIKRKYDCYILTEDDNVFAPAFLDFMNKGLEKFKDDDNVYALCGYRYYADLKFSENSFFMQNVDVCCWGIGRWTSKCFPINYRDYRKLLSFRSFCKVYRRAGIEKAIYFLNCCHSKWDGRMVDMVQSVYMVLNDLYEVMPRTSLVKNIGMDDSGENFNNMPADIKERFDSQVMSDAERFAFVGTGYEFFEDNQVIYKLQYPNKLPRKKALKLLMKALLKCVAFR